MKTRVAKVRFYFNENFKLILELDFEAKHFWKWLNYQILNLLGCDFKVFHFSFDDMNKTRMNWTFKSDSRVIQNWFKIDSNFKVDSMLIQSWFKRYSELRKLHYLINVCSKLCNKIGWNVYKITSRVYLECIRPTWFLLLFVKRASGEVGVVALFPSLLLLALAPSMRRFSAKRCSHCTLEPTLCFPPLVLWAQFLPPHWGSRWQRGNKHINIRLSYTTTM